MAPNRADLERAVEKGEQEDGAIEFKERLNKETHLADGRRESLAAQMRHRVLSGDGEATYVIGVTDDGGIAGIPREDFTETMDVLSLLAEEADARIEDVQTWHLEGGVVGLATIRAGSVFDVDDDHIVVGTAGHVDHGKSTLIGSLITGRSDDGAGDLREYLDTRPHEAERGLSATISHAVYGFDKDDDPINVRDPTRSEERAELVENAPRLVSFVDTVGHEPWLRTTIRGLVGQKLDYGLLTVAADDGPTKTTREHLGILLATDLPVIVAVTKTDLVDDEQVEMTMRTIERHLRDADVTPIRIDRVGVEQTVEEIDTDVAPVIPTSSVTREGIDTLDRLFAQLPKTHRDEGEFRMYVDRVYDVHGVGAVASGAIKQGRVEVGDELLLGPFPDGEFREVEARSIELHHHRVDAAEAGRIVGINLHGVDADELERGMTLLPADASPEPVREFEAEVMVLNHPTSIHEGYEPVVHLETVSEAAIFHPEEDDLLPGDKGLTRVRFKFQPHLVEEGQKFIFREGQAKGVGTVTDIFD